KLSTTYLHCPHTHRNLHSFPTRRSSDLETPSENAQRFFTRYRKLVNSAKVVKKEIHKTIHEINYLRNLLQQIDTAHESDIRNSRSEEHTSELQSRFDLVCRLLLEKKNRH